MIWEDMGTVIGKGFQTQLRSSSNLIIDSWLNWTFRKLIYRRKIAVLLSQTSMFAGWWGLPTPLKNHGVSSSVGMMTDIPNMMGKSSWNSMVPVTTNQMMYSQSTSLSIPKHRDMGSRRVPNLTHLMETAASDWYLRMISGSHNKRVCNNCS